MVTTMMVTMMSMMNDTNSKGEEVIYIYAANYVVWILKHRHRVR